MVRKIAVIVGLILILGLFYSLGRQIYDSLQVNARLDQETEELSGLQKKNKELREKLAYTQTIKFVEMIARDKLNLARPNETIVIIPQAEIKKILGAWQEKKEEIIPNWQGWLRLFWK